MWILAAVLAGCGQSEPARPAAAPTPTPAPTAKAANPIIVPIKVVGLDKQPLANMMPIATSQPNAFNKPVAKGELTNVEGRSSIALTNGQHVYLRAWDPTRRMFANNYFEVFAGGTAVPKNPLTVVMASGAALEVTLLKPDHKPAANADVGLMMFHPQKGPWWPDETHTNAQGVARFPSIPPGKFTIKLKAAGAGQIEIPDVALPPAGSTNLGAVILQ